MAAEIAAAVTTGMAIVQYVRCRDRVMEKYGDATARFDLIDLKRPCVKDTVTMY